MDCAQCGARLPGKSDRCCYCGSLNDIDLRKIHHFTEHQTDQPRNCPNCELSLKTVDLQVGQKFLVDRCESCLGIFFDPNEIEALVNISVSHVNDVDFTKLDILLDERSLLEKQTVKYIKCPTCEKHMNRKNYGMRSGVVIDWCKEHGVWLDGGELNRIMLWVKAGGQIHCGNRQEERRRIAAQQQAQAASQLSGNGFYSSEKDELTTVLSIVQHIFQF